MPKNILNGQNTYSWNSIYFRPDFIRHINPLVVDIEAVNFANSSEIIDLAVLSYEGEVLFSEQIRPSNKVDRWSYSVHGYSDIYLKSKKRFKYHYDEIYSLIQGRVIVSYNGQADLRFLTSSVRKNLLTMPNIAWICLANNVKKLLGSKNQVSLKKACQIFGIEEELKPHKAVNGARVCLNLLHKIEEEYGQQN